MKRLFRYKYPKLTILAVISFFAYLIFSNPKTELFISQVSPSGNLSIFIAGLLFSFGFTAPISLGLFILSEPSNILLASLLGGLGALISDLLIFSFIRISFMDEFEKLAKTKVFKTIQKEATKGITKKIRNYIFIAFAGLIITSPLPDELGVSLLAGFTKINTLLLSIISFICNSAGIFVILFLSKQV